MASRGEKRKAETEEGGQADKKQKGNVKILSRFEGQVFLVTGGSQGLGEAVCCELAIEGARGIVINGRDKKKGEEAEQRLNQKFPNTKFVFVRADLASLEDCAACVKACEEHFGDLHGVAQCAALTHRGNIENTTPELYDKMFAVNTRAPFFIMQDSIKLMKKKGHGGAIVNISSVSSYGGQTFLTPYCASKGALNVMTKNVAYQMAKDKIRCNALCIGWMSTPGEHITQTKEDGAPEDWLEKADASQPLGRILRPGEVAKMTAHLLSSESEMISGSLIDMGVQVPMGCS